VDPWAAAVIGSVASVIVIEAIFFFDQKAKIDDPVGAISVHGIGGLFGVICVGIFSNGKYGAGWNLTEGVEGGVTGILYGGSGAEQLIVQLIGVATIIVVGFGLSYAFFKIQNALTKGGIRSKPEDEVSGLDLPEMGVLAYPPFDSIGPGDGSPAPLKSKEVAR
jgi:ammonium transporter, Amt family